MSLFRPSDWTLSVKCLGIYNAGRFTRPSVNDGKRNVIDLTMNLFKSLFCCFFLVFRLWGPDLATFNLKTEFYTSKSFHGTSPGGL